MNSTTNKSRHFKRTEWQAGTLSTVLSDLAHELNARDVNVKFKGTQSDGTALTIDGGPEKVGDVTGLPVGQGVLTVQYNRERGDSADVSNVDILSIDMLTVDIVSVVFGASAAEYQIAVQARNSDLTNSAFALLKDRLSLQEIPQP